MTEMFYPLTNLRISLQEYIEDTEEPTGELYEQASFAISEMHCAIADYMLSNKDNSILKRYMHTWQEQIRLLFDEIPYAWIESMDLFEENEHANEFVSQRNHICFECFRLIKEMEIGYPAFFDENCFPPKMYLILEKSRHYFKWMLASEWVSTRKGRFKEAWQIIERYVNRLWDLEYNFSYREIAYGINFVNQLMNSIQSGGDKFDTQALYTFLIYINFNDISFIHYITRDIKEEVGTMILVNEKTAFLKELQKDLEANIVRLDCTLDAGNPPITTMIVQWIKMELEVLQT